MWTTISRGHLGAPVSRGLIHGWEYGYWVFIRQRHWTRSPRAAEFFLHPEELNSAKQSSLNTAAISELIQIVLTTNSFMFDKDFFLQVSRVSTGSPMPGQRELACSPQMSSERSADQKVRERHRKKKITSALGDRFRNLLIGGSSRKKKKCVSSWV